ncbi:hypothetical protein J2858_000321 [Neorhizobium galegae]|uniref:hypothetical protein n=1 Tax=Neorhizobium galegae TaxID=399 RepID=UPI001FD88B86|nr:hypothetical protein [Neorhizobium galegae]MBP2547428.1 hypothetical protein [Neorhizobium galegae]
MKTQAANIARPSALQMALAAAGVLLSVTVVTDTAFALSGASVTEASGPAPAAGTGSGADPASGPLSNPPGNGAAAPEAAPQDAQAATPAPAEIIRDLELLPEPVKAARRALVEAATSGEFERLRPLVHFDVDQMRQLGADGADALDALKSLSGDPEGLEILAIMLDLLQTGAARINAGTPDEMYVWPYFVGKPLDTLSAPERVELLRIITAGDLAAMEETNNYNFYRLGITPSGEWKMFTGGD